MVRYRKIDVRIWTDETVRSLSDDAHLVWFFLLTNPETTAIPGIYRMGMAQAAECMGWPLKRFRRAFDELARQGMAVADWRARVVHIPNALRYDPPANWNVIKGKSWGMAWDEIPECPLKQAAYELLREHCESRGEPFAKAFRERLCEPSCQPATDGCSNQEQEAGTGERREATDVAAFVEVWNANRGDLPEARTLNAARRKMIRAALREEADLDLWAKAIRLQAEREFCVQRRYGIETLLSEKNRAKYLDAARNGSTAGLPRFMRQHLAGEEVK